MNCSSLSLGPSAVSRIPVFALRCSCHPSTVHPALVVRMVHNKPPRWNGQPWRIMGGRVSLERGREGLVFVADLHYCALLCTGPTLIEPLQHSAKSLTFHT